MDIRAEARRLASIATVFVWVGWFFVIYAIVAGIFWFIDLAQTPQFNFLESLGLSAAAIGGPIFLALIVAGMGHFLRLFSLWAASQSSS
jgi:amino acid transporter